MPIHLPEHWEHFIREQVRSGRFASEADVLEEALSLLKRRESPESSGAPDPGSIDAIIDDVMSDLPAEAVDRLPTDGAEQHDHYIYRPPGRSR